MTILPLVIAPDERLNTPSEKVAVVDASIRTLLNDMLETMYANDGIGLAAVQVGVHKRCIVVDVAVRTWEASGNAVKDGLPLLPIRGPLAATL